MFKFNFRRIFQRVQEGEYTRAIISYLAIPFEHKAVPVMDDEGKWITNFVVKSVRKMLVIELWVCTLEIRWVKEMK